MPAPPEPAKRKPFGQAGDNSDMAPEKRKGRKVVDWDAVEPDYRAGLLSLTQLEAKHNVSGPGILKHAKKFKWSRDLTAKINARAEELVNRQMVSELVSAEARANEAQIIESVAMAQVRVLNEHRRDIGRARGLYLRLMGRLEDEVTVDEMTTIELAAAAALTLDEQQDAREAGAEVSTAKAWESVLERIGYASFRPNKAGRDPVNELYHQIISTPGRIKAMKEASEVLKNLVALEREAYRIEKMADDSGTGGRKSLPVRFVEAAQQIEHDTGDDS